MTGLPAKQPDRFIETEIEDEVVLMNLDSGNFFSLSGSGLAIWRAMDEAPEREALLDRLAADYGVPQIELVADVEAFLRDLAAAGFVDG